jgi:serine/threonine protein kinase
MVNFQNEADKANLNMMRAQVKIIDFGFACIKKNGLVYTAVGNPQGMDPLILKKFLGIKKKTEGYDEKVDIWSLGAICYELLLGQPIFDAKSLDELSEKIEKGIYSLPTNLSQEIVSFLNGMLQYDSKNRYTAEDLVNHPFLKARVKDFHKIDLHRVSKKVKNGNLNINVKENKTIWAIFNEEDEKKLLDVGLMNSNDYSTINNFKPINVSMKPINESMTIGKNNFQNYIPPGGRNFYGINMFPNDSQSQINMSQKINNPSNNMNNKSFINYPTFNIPTLDMSKYLNNININSNATLQNNKTFTKQISQEINHSNYIPANNHIINDDEKGSGCYIY